jgi:uncharacterized protein (TIGR03067 family)
MTRYAVAVLAVVLATDAPKAGLLAADAPKKDKEGLQGTWKVVSVEKGGKDQEVGKGFVMVFDKDTFAVKRGDDVIVKGTFKVDPAKKPKAIDMTITEAKKEEYKDKEVHGIYELEKDSLKWCMAEPGENDRPTEFATKEGTQRLLVTFNKEKP